MVPSMGAIFLNITPHPSNFTPQTSNFKLQTSNFSPVSKQIIYQLLPRLFGRQAVTNVPAGTIQQNGCGKFNDFDEQVLRRIHDMGVSHVWFTGVIRHATQTDYSQYGIPTQHPDVVKGRAGSPYAIADYYDVDPDLAVDVDRRMEEWMALIERTHRAGMKVVLDFVPNHVARQYRSIAKPVGVKDLGEDDNRDYHFSTANNFYYCWGQPLDLSLVPTDPALDRYVEQPAKATGNDHFDNRPSRNDWYETVKLNYGIDYCDAGGRSEHFDSIPDTWSKMTEILLFWAQKGVDAFRCDMAEMVPTAFWHWAIDKLKFVYPDIQFIGEVYDPAQYRAYLAAGFDLLYDKVGMYDCLRGVVCGYTPSAEITRAWQATDDIRDHMLYFLENHDEQRIASDFFASDARRGLPALVVATLLQTNPLMLYAGQEFGEKGMEVEGFSGHDGRTTIFDYWTVDTLRRGFFDRRKLRREERQLEKQYLQVLQVANKEKAVREGQSFDLMYVNPQLARQQYAFLRKAGTDVLLVVANFADAEVTVDVNIPSHAFDFLAIPQRAFKGTDLLSTDKISGSLVADGAVSMTVPAWGARVWKLKL